MPGKGSGYRPGIPQQPYTKWDADKDEVEVDYKQLDKKQHASWFTGRKGSALKILLVLVVFSLGLIIGYVLRRSVHEFIISSQMPCLDRTDYRDYSEELSRQLRSYISSENIDRNLKAYTKNVHMTATHNNNLLRDKLQEQLADYKLRVKTAKYNVLLSYAQFDIPNSISLVDTNGSVVLETNYNGPHERFHPELSPFNAYSPNGSVKGELVYANFGEEKDFHILKQKGVQCKDKIVIMRYGAISRGAKVANAEKCEAAAAILYSDPAQVTMNNGRQEDTFPRSPWLPEWGTQRGSVEMGAGGGDPLTPGLPSKEGIYRIPREEAALPNIPVQPIGYDIAQQLMSNMAGPMGPTSFLGSMHHNVTYHLGPGFNPPKENQEVLLEVNNEMEERPITNVFGIINGVEEPDHYVIVGCHYDAWTFGGADPNSGTAVLMEVAKSFGNLSNTGWQPRRTIIFAHWDAEEHNIIGSYEWVEENFQELSVGTVAYINLDSAVMGNTTLGVQATPLFHNLIYNSTRAVPPPGRDSGTDTLYDAWRRHTPGSDSTMGGRIKQVGSGSDQAAFLYTLGVPVAWLQFLSDDLEYSDTYPGYHTAIDNYELVSRLLDPGFAAHRSMAELLADTLLQLSSRPKLPFDCRVLAITLGEEFNSLHGFAQGIIDSDKFNLFNLTMLDYLDWAIGNFSDDSEAFMKLYTLTSSQSETEVQRLNHQLMKLSRAFIHPEGLQDRPIYKNILFAPSATNNHRVTTFTNIRDALSLFSRNPRTQHKLIQEVERQISIATTAVRSASRILNRSIIGS